MKEIKVKAFIFSIFAIGTLFLNSCSNEKSTPFVVVYTSVDRNVSEPILKDFELKTGIKILPLYDIEASKTVGLTKRLIAEKDRPRADLFWNSEFVQTISLKNEGILAPIEKKSILLNKNVIERDKENYWIGFGGRARVIMVNIEKLDKKDYPSSFSDLLNPKYQADKIGFSYPLFGTAATHAAAVFQQMGEESAETFFNSVQERGIHIVDGNAVVRDLVVSGALDWGYLDTDDANAAIERGASVEIIVPDQGEGGDGTLVIPNTLALIANGKNRAEAEKLIEYLLSDEVSQKLNKLGWFGILQDKKPTLPPLDIYDIKRIDISADKIYKNLQNSHNALKKIFVK